MSSNKKKSAGFTLLELMIVLFIIVILAIIALPQYQKTVLHAKETVLKDSLQTMRKMLDQYAADKGKLPQSENDLVTEGYLREIPISPMMEDGAEDKGWTWDRGKDNNSVEGEEGITDVHSTSTDTSSEGTPYNEW